MQGQMRDFSCHYESTMYLLPKLGSLEQQIFRNTQVVLWCGKLRADPLGVLPQGFLRLLSSDPGLQSSQCSTGKVSFQAHTHHCVSHGPSPDAPECPYKAAFGVFLCKEEWHKRVVSREQLRGQPPFLCSLIIGEATYHFCHTLLTRSKRTESSSLSREGKLNSTY
jgi:hypothetical protein